MFVIYRMDKEGSKRRERVKELKTLEEAREFLKEHEGDDCYYTVVME